jgi:hypothetical protein
VTWLVAMVALRGSEDSGPLLRESLEETLLSS